MNIEKFNFEGETLVVDFENGRTLHLPGEVVSNNSAFVVDSNSLSRANWLSSSEKYTLISTIEDRTRNDRLRIVFE